MNIAFSSQRVESVDAPSVRELVDLVANYAKQETLDPIRGVGRWLAYGLVAVLSLLLGVTILALGALRLLQFEVFAGSTTWSWVPYLIVAVLCAVVVALALSRINKNSLHTGKHS